VIASVAFRYLTTVLLSYLIGRAIENFLISWQWLPASTLTSLRLGSFETGISLGPISGLALALSLLIILLLRERVVHFLRLPIAVLNSPVYWLSTVVPKKENLWLYSCRQGDAFAENSRYLFEHTLQQHPTIDAIWITKSWRIRHELKELNYPVCFAYSPTGYWLSLRAACVFISNFGQSCADYNDYATGPKTTKIQLWHGSPMKRIGEARVDLAPASLVSQLRKRLKATFPFYKNRTACHKMLAASPKVASALSAAFNLQPHHIWIAGYPKNDRWLSNVRRSEVIEGSSSLERSVIYMPTWRDDCPQLFTHFDFDLERMNGNFKANNIHFYIKVHHFSVKELRVDINGIDEKSNVHVLEIEDIYQSLEKYDLLVTDYSSILFDYLLADRPVVFAPFDYDDYIQNEVGFLSDYGELTPGLCAKNWKELEEHILTAFAQDDFSDQRRRLCNVYNAQQGTNSCKNVIALTRKLMEQPVFNEPAHHH